MRLLVVHFDEGFDGRDQCADAVMAATFDLTLGEQDKPALHLIEPRGMGGSEVEMVARSFGQPARDERSLMSGVVIQD